MITPIRYRIGDATHPEGYAFLPKIIAHGCNDVGAWGAGFTGALSRRWHQPEAEYRYWFSGAFDPPPALGQAQFVAIPDRTTLDGFIQEEAPLWVANLITQEGIAWPSGVQHDAAAVDPGRPPRDPPIRYGALREACQRLARFAARHGASVHMPRIGCGLAGGEWTMVEPILQQTLVRVGIEVIVYDLPGTYATQHRVRQFQEAFL